MYEMIKVICGGFEIFCKFVKIELQMTTRFFIDFKLFSNYTYQIINYTKRGNYSILRTTGLKRAD